MVIADPIQRRNGLASHSMPCTAGMLEPHVKPFDITGKPMKNWVLVNPEGIEDEQLKGWIQRAVRFVGNMPAK